MKLTKVIALALVVSLLRLSVAAATAVPATPGQLSGTLLLRGAARVSLNGAQVGTGTTVFSGSVVETGDAAGAVVQLAGLGRLEITPSSSLTLNFDRGSVTVLVSKGDAVLTTADGIKGTVVQPDGAPGAPAPQSGGNKKIFGLSRALFVTLLAGAGGAVIIAALIAGDNPSPSRP